jgi:hypothetical protein
MIINFNPKYIPGDIVYNHKKEIIRITSSYLKGTKLFYYRDGNYGWIREDAIKPIPLTPEILEKNGWNKSTGWSYVGSGKRGYQFSKELDDKCVELDRMIYGDLQICQCENLRDWSYINECNHYFRFEFTYVHELQHLLYALHIDSNLKI